MSEIERLRALLAEATPGPWEADDTSDWTNDSYGDEEGKPPTSGWFRNCGVGKVDAGDYSTLTFADAALIAAAVNALPALLEVAEVAAEFRRLACIFRVPSPIDLFAALDRLDGAT